MNSMIYKASIVGWTVPSRILAFFPPPVFAAAWLGLFLQTISLASAQVSARNQTQQPERADLEVHVLPVQGNVYMLHGAGANITLQIGKDGVLLVDTGLARMADKVIAAIRSVSKEPIRYVINTTADDDHVGGNEAISKIARSIVGDNAFTDVAGPNVIPGASIISHLNVLNRMVSATGLSRDAWPNDTYSTNQKKLFINGEGVVLYHEPAAHADGDSIVFFRRSDVISAGDLFNTEMYPVIDLQRGGSIQGLLAGVNHIIELAIPADKQEGGTLIIPGHGRLCDQADIVEYQTMLTIIRDRIQDMVKKGMTLDEIKAAKPTFDYDNRYGRTSGSWTTEMFVEAIYKSLSKK